MPTENETDTLNLDAIESRAKKASRGPWSIGLYGSPKEGTLLGYTGDPVAALSADPADKAFIAAARTDVQALVARVRELEALARDLADEQPRPNAVAQALAWDDLGRRARALVGFSPDRDFDIRWFCAKCSRPIVRGSKCQTCSAGR